MTFLLGEQKASRETRSCWPFSKDSYNVFSHTHTHGIHPWLLLLLLLLLPAVCFCSVLFLLVQWPMDGSFPPFSFLSSFFLLLGTSRYLTSYAMYILYTVDARYMPGIYIIKLRYYLPYLTFSPPPSRERMKNTYVFHSGYLHLKALCSGLVDSIFYLIWNWNWNWNWIGNISLSFPPLSPFPLPLSLLLTWL